MCVTHHIKNREGITKDTDTPFILQVWGPFAFRWNKKLGPSLMQKNNLIYSSIPEARNGQISYFNV